MLIAVALICLGFLALALYRLDWALLVIAAALPAYLIRFKVGPLPLTLLEAMILIAALVWVAKDFWSNNRQWLKRGGRRPNGRVNYPYAGEMIAVLLVSLGAAFISDFSLNALGIWKAYFFEPILLFILLVNAFKQPSDIKRLFFALAFTALGISVFAIYQQLTGQLIANPFWAAAETRRVTSFFDYPNAVGLYLAPVSLLLCGMWLSIKNGWSAEKIFISAVIVSSWLAVYFAKSEGALVALGAGLGLLGLLYSRRSRWLTLLFVLTILSGVLLQGNLKSWATDKLALRDLSGEIRKQQWRETFTMLKDGRVISGAGLDNYQSSVAPYHQAGIFYNSDNLPNFHSVVWASSTLQKKYWQPVEIYKYPHNIVLNFWTEIGLFGLLLFIWLFGKAIVYNWQAATNQGAGDLRPLAWGAMIATISLIVHGFVDVPYFKNDLAALFWIILALGSLLRLQMKDKEIKEKI